MAQKTKLEITSNRLPELARKLPGVASQIVRKTALDIEAAAKANAPVDTGALRNSIQASPESETEWIVAVGVAYGHFVEYGTHHSPAQPYLTPAADAARPGYEAAIRAALEDL